MIPTIPAVLIDGFFVVRSGITMLVTVTVSMELVVVVVIRSKVVVTTVVLVRVLVLVSVVVVVVVIVGVVVPVVVVEVVFVVSSTGHWSTTKVPEPTQRTQKTRVKESLRELSNTCIFSTK